MKQDLPVLQANLDELDRASDYVAYHGSGDVRGFFHRLLMKCAGQMSHQEFITAIQAVDEKRPA